MNKTFVCALLSIGLACGTPNAVRADGPLPGYYQDPGINPNRATVNHNVDEHIDPFTGMLQLHHTDAVLPGNGGFDLIMQRSFNSPTSTYGFASDTTSYNKTPNVGVGWSLFIGGRLYAGTACTGSDRQMVFETPDGGRQALMSTGLGDFLSTTRWRAVCGGGGVQVYAPNGTRYDMFQIIAEAIPNTIQGASFWYPTHIEDRNGNYANFSYGTQGAYTLLNSITTSDGRTISFSYVAAGTLYLLDHVTTAQGSWYYDYEIAFNNISGQGVAYLLRQVRPPAGAYWQYFYNACPSAGAGSCSISQMNYPEGGSINYTYALVNFNDGPYNASVVTSKTANHAIGIQGPPTDYTTQFTYAPGSAGVEDVTTVTNVLGSITYNHIGFATAGSGSAWKIGLLSSRTMKTPNGTTLQSETFAWDKQQISPFPMNRGYGVLDPVTNAPVLTQHVISRNGSSYTTSYSNFDTYGNAQTVSETGEKSHTTTRAFYVDTTKWILNTPANESTTGIGAITRQFDANSNLLNETRYGTPTVWTYSSTDGSILSRTDANGHGTLFSGYSNGIPQVEQRPEAVTINRTVDAAGNVASQSDGAGHVYAYTYDGLRRPTGKTPPIGAPTTTVWTGSALRQSTRGAYVESLLADGVANPYMLTRAGIRSAFGHDVLSNRTVESLPGDVYDQPDGTVKVAGTVYTRDILGRPTKIANSDGTFRTLTYVGNLVSEENERNLTTTYRYAAFGDPDRKFLVGIDLPTRNNMTIGRDDLGNITSVTQGSVTRTYHYNASFFLTSIDDPETGTTTFGRDAVGNMTSRTVNGRTTAFAYDGLNRLTTITYPAGTPTTITYLGNGRTASVSNGAAARTYAYDANANLTSETLTVGAQTFTVGYTYNGNDALATMTYPRTNEVITYNPDSLGRPTSASPFIAGASYSDSGNPQQMVYASGVTMNFQENARQWPSNLAAGKGGTAPDFLGKSYFYDATGNVSGIIDAVDPSQSLAMSYDRINQLASVNGPWGSSAVSYDPVGNITSYAVGQQTGNYLYSSNRLASMNTQQFIYDGYGNVTSDGQHAFLYDDASNLICVDCGGANEIDYAYDGNNRRVSRTKAGVTTYYVHAANGDLLLEYTPSTGATLEHIYLRGKRIATKRLP